MDLINLLIKTKQADDIDLSAWLNELVQYDKLAKVEKFKHINQSEFMQKKLPLCYQAFQGDPIAFYICHELGLIIQQTTGESLPLLQDIDNLYSKKKQRQLEIIGQSNQYHFTYYDLRQMPHDIKDKVEQLMYLKVNVNERTVALTAIGVKGHQVAVYSGTLRINTENEGIVETKDQTLKPYHRKISDTDSLNIRSYSVNGNNDYDFGWTNQYDISMPSNHQIRYTRLDNHEAIIVDVDDNDVRAFSLERNDIDKLADLVIKYLPKEG